MKIFLQLIGILVFGTLCKLLEPKMEVRPEVHQRIPDNDPDPQSVDLERCFMYERCAGCPTFIGPDESHYAYVHFDLPVGTKVTTDMHADMAARIQNRMMAPPGFRFEYFHRHCYRSRHGDHNITNCMEI